MLFLLADNRCNILYLLKFLLDLGHIIQAVYHDADSAFKQALFGFNDQLVHIHVHLLGDDFSDFTKRADAVQTFHVNGYREQAVLNLPLNRKDMVTLGRLELVGYITFTFMYCDMSVFIDKAQNRISRDRITAVCKSILVHVYVIDDKRTLYIDVAGTCVFGLLILGLAAFVLFLLKSIRDGRTKTTRGRALEAAAAAADEDDDDDEFYFDDDDEAEYDEDDTEAEEASDAETEESDEAEADEAAAEEDADQTVKASVTPDSTITMEVPEEVEPTEIPSEEIEAAIATETAQIEKNMSKDAEEAEQQVTEEVQEEVTVFAEVPSKDEEVADSFRETESEAEKFEDEEYENDDDEDYEDEGDDEDYDEEEYEDEDEEDEEYDEEDYDEDEDEESGSRAAKRSSSKGGFFGFLKKMFSSESEEDAEEGEDFDDYEDEPDEHEFDEFKEYPEDIDLLPREDEDDGDYLDEEEFSDDSTEETENERGRLSMQRVMKNVSYKEEEADFSQDDDLSDSLFDDDDDMEYSFISNRKK